jgi:iron complex outermembrane receptor protein
MKSSRALEVATHGVLGSAALTLVASTALAQQSDLVEIVVTAQKREQRLQEVPISVSVLSGESVERLGFRNLQDAAVYVPSLNFRTDHSQRAFISFRGIGGSGGAVPGVAIFVDGVYQPTAVFFSAPLLDVERIEFLKGPQGTLYGRNTLSGAISVISRAPSNDLNGSVEAGVGNADTYSLRGALNLPLQDDRMFLRLAVAHEETDGFVRNVVTGGSGSFRKSDTARASLRWLPVESLQLDLSGYWSEQNNAANSYAIVPLGDIDSVPRTVTLDTQSRTAFSIYGGSLRASWALDDDQRIVSISSYDRQLTDRATFDVDYSAAPAQLFDTLPFSKTIAQELRFETAVGTGGQLAVGGFYTKVDGESRQRFLLNGTTTVQRSVQLTELENWAAFANLSVRPVDKLELAAGLRYDSTDRSSSALNLLAAPGPTNPFNLQAKESIWQPKASVTWFWSPDVMTYASIARGYRVGGFNGIAAPPQFRSFESETTWNYEIGAKTSWLDRRVSLNAAFFYVEDTNAQELQIVLGTNNAPTNAILNGGEIRVRGFELELAAVPVANLQLSASASLNDAVVRKHPDPLRVGQRQFSVDRWRFSAQGRYSWPLGEGREVFMAADYAGFGPTQFAATVRQDYKSLLGAQAGVQLGGFRAEVYTKNLLDEDYVQIYSAVGLLVGPRGLSLPADPRSYGLRLRYEF